MKRFFTLSIAIVLFLAVVPTLLAQSPTVHEATPDRNGDGMATSDEFGEIIVSGYGLIGATHATVLFEEENATCEGQVVTATFNEVILDIGDCIFFPHVGTFVVALTVDQQTVSDSFTLSLGERYSNQYTVGG